MKRTPEEKAALEARLAGTGMRLTRQRLAVLNSILDSPDHPTASVIYDRVRKMGIKLSLATVYNCLESMSEAEIINHLRFDNKPSRYCANLVPHAHVMDEENNRVLDVQLKKGLKPEDVFELPEGVQICSMDVYMHGCIPETALAR